MGTPGTDLLLERDGALAAIDRALAGARAGEGGCVVVAGAAGLGKTRLLAVARERARAQELRVLHARGDDLEREFPFGVAVQLYASAVAGDADAALLTGAARLAGPLFDPSADTPAEHDASSVFHGLHWLTANIAEPAPLLLCIDDLQWSDKQTLRFLVYLAQRLDELPVAVVVAVRPGEASTARLVARLAEHPTAERVELAQLSERAVAALAEDALGPPVHPAFAEACHRVTGGNPLFLRELLSAAAEDGVAPAADEVERIEQLGSRSVGAVILRRLSAFPEDAVRLTEAVAVLGDRCRLEHALALAGLDPDDGADVADGLAEAGLLASGEALSFGHPLIREAVDAELPRARRHRLHLRAARLVGDAGADPERVAEHLVRADEAGEPWAIAALRAGARYARARGAPGAAARYLRVAARDGGADVLAELALAEARARHDDAVERALAAVAATEPEDRGAIGRRLGLALLETGRHDDAVRVFDAALADLADDHELAAPLRAERSAAAGLGGIGDVPPQLDELERRALAGQATGPERAVLAHGSLTAGVRGTSATEAARYARAALSGPPLDPLRAGDMVTAALALTGLLVADELDEVIALTSRLIDQSRELGVVASFATTSHLRAHAYERAGRLQDAIVDAQSAIEAARYGWEPALPAAHAVLALALIERGELAAARVAVELPNAAERFGHSLTWNDLLEARARLALATGDPAGAMEHALAAGRNLEALGMAHPGVVPWRATAARAALALGDAERAAQLADADLREAAAFGAPREHGAALRVAAQVAGGDRGIALLRDAVEVLAASDARLEEAHARSDLGAALLAEGHRLAAREPLRAALDEAHRLGAAPLAERSHADLVRAGSRPRRPRTSGRDALTPREERLVQMAASGMTNREIAEALFITKKTVETHLAHAFRKLGVASRAELRNGALAPPRSQE